MIVGGDTSPLLHLARIGQIDLIPAVVGRVLLPRTVWSELTQTETRSAIIDLVAAATWIETVDDPPMQDLGLDRGETAAILLAESVRADALLIDERRGRSVATSRGIAVLGTLGILTGARRSGRLARAAPLVAALRADGFWLSDALVAEFLASLGESP